MWSTTADSCSWQCWQIGVAAMICRDSDRQRRLL